MCFAHGLFYQNIWGIPLKKTEKNDLNLLEIKIFYFVCDELKKSFVKNWGICKKLRDYKSGLNLMIKVVMAKLVELEEARWISERTQRCSFVQIWVENYY